MAAHIDTNRVARARHAHERRPEANSAPVPFRKIKRDKDESDTEDTDDEHTWGGLGVFEYSAKGLPHASVHTPELIMRGGHHAAFCTFLVETGHKKYIKMAARYSWTRASRNDSQDNMLGWVLEQIVYDAVLLLLEKERHIAAYHDDTNDSAAEHDDTNDSAAEHETDNANTTETMGMQVLPLQPLDHILAFWHDVTCTRDRIPAKWTNSFLSKHVLVTPSELFRLLCCKFRIENTARNHFKLLHRLHWGFYGVIRTNNDGFKRKFFGSGVNPNRGPDFVRICGRENNTCLSAQVCSTLATICVQRHSYVLLLNMFLFNRWSCSLRSPGFKTTQMRRGLSSQDTWTNQMMVG